LTDKTGTAENLKPNAICSFTQIQG